MDTGEEDGGIVTTMVTLSEEVPGNLSAALDASVEQEARLMRTDRRPPSGSTTAEGREIEDMIQNVWEAEEIRGEALLESYQECVRINLIDKMSTKERRRLRNYLRENGAPIRQGLGIPIYRALTEVLPDETDSGSENTTLPPLIGPSLANTSNPVYTQAPSRTRPYNQVARSNQRRGNTRRNILSGAGAQNRNASRTQGTANAPRSNAQRTIALSDDPLNHGDAMTRNPPTPIHMVTNPGSRVSTEAITNNAAARDLLKLYSMPFSKYGGELEENLYRHKREYEMNCLSLQVSPQKALENVYICLKDVALEYYFAEIRCNARSVTEVFEMLQKRFISEDRKQRSLMEWQTITFSDCREAADDDRKTLTRLLKRAMQLQSQLDKRYLSV